MYVVTFGAAFQHMVPCSVVVIILPSHREDRQRPRFNSGHGRVPFFSFLFFLFKPFLLFSVLLYVWCELASLKVHQRCTTKHYYFYFLKLQLHVEACHDICDNMF